MVSFLKNGVLASYNLHVNPSDLVILCIARGEHI